MNSIFNAYAKGTWTQHRLFALQRQAVQLFPGILALLSTVGNSLTYCSQEVIFSLGSLINDTTHLFQ